MRWGEMRIFECINGELEVRSVPEPVKGNDEIMIKVLAFAINRADLLHMDGLYGRGERPGLEVCGIDVESGKIVSALLQSGGFGEYVCAKKEHVIEKPKTYTTEEGAACMESMVTFFMNMELCSASSGQTVLIHGGSSGLGSAGIQMCKLFGMEVIATAGNDLKLEKCKAIGADQVINYNSNFAETFKGKVDIVFDILGGAFMNSNISVLKNDGRIASIAVMSGSKAAVNLGGLLMKNATIYFRTLRSQSNECKSGLIQRFNKCYGPFMESGDLRPVIDSSYDVGKMKQAIGRMRSREHFGKIVLTW